MQRADEIGGEYEAALEDRHHHKVVEALVRDLARDLAETVGDGLGSKDHLELEAG